MPIDLQAIDERIAKAKEEADFWEKARAVLADPRLQALTSPQPRPVSAPSWQSPSGMPRAYGEIQDKVYSVLPEADSRATLTTSEIVAKIQQQGYTFQAKEPSIAVNGALISLESKGIAQMVGKVGNAKCWRKKRQKAQELASEPQNQEAPEGAS